MVHASTHLSGDVVFLAPLLAIEIPLDPDIGKLGPFLITWHGLFTAVGILGGVWLALRIARATGFDPDHAYNLALAGVPSGIIGARLLYVAEHWDFYGEYPGEIIALTEGGISIWGAVLGGVLGGLIFARWARYPIGRGLDVAAFGLILGMAIGRIGDLINGEHLASATSLPWGVYYTDPNSPAFAHSINVGPHHPATTYEMLADMAILGVMFLLLFRVAWFRARPGLTFCFYMISYAAMRFAVSYTRLDSADTILGMTVPQLVSAIVILATLPLAWYFAYRYRDPLAPAAPTPPPGRVPVRSRRG